MSLEKELQELEREILQEEEKYYRNKVVVRQDLSKKDAFLILKAERDKHMKRVFHEYDMDYCYFGNNKILKCHLTPLQLKYVQAITNFLCKDSSLKPLSTFAGKSAEMAFRNSVNNLFHLFGIKKRIQLNSKNFVYGGDGGADFFIGSLSFDVKYRNDSPSHGMILERSFLDRTLDDVVLIHVTNSDSIKIGQNETTEKSLPLALSGWMPVKEFKQIGQQINNNRDSLAVDKLYPIVDLLLLVLEDHINSESLFVYP